MFKRLVNDESGFIYIYMSGLFAIVLILVLALILTAAVGARKNAVASYSWFAEAADFASYTAAMNGITTANDQNAPQVEQYFDAGFSSITQTSPPVADGNQFTPLAGSPFPGVVTLDSFTAVAGGYSISITVPVLIGTVPIIGPQTVNVPMSYTSEL